MGVCSAFAAEWPPHGEWDGDALAVYGRMVFAEEYHAVVVFEDVVINFSAENQRLSVFFKIAAKRQPELP